METPQSLRKLQGFQRAELFEKLAREKYGRNWRAESAFDFGVDGSTVYRWVKNGSVPFAVIFALQEWNRPDDAAHFTGIAQSLAKTARQLEMLALAREAS